MSPRQSKSGSRGRRAGSNTRRAASGRRGSQANRQAPARTKRGRLSGSSAAYAVKLLKQDHRAVAEALEEFDTAAHEEKQEIAHRICRMLEVHTQMEEELLYPAARDVLDSDDAHLVAEARVEHASVKDLIAQIEARQEVDEQYEAKVCVMGEFVKHHVKEEETELFPKLERSSLDLDALGKRLEERKKELMGEEAWSARDALGLHEEEEGGMRAGRSRGGRGHRSGALHAHRR
jgi:hemerythrin-like domain-containing protein